MDQNNNSLIATLSQCSTLTFGVKMALFCYGSHAHFSLLISIQKLRFHCVFWMQVTQGQTCVNSKNFNWKYHEGRLPKCVICPSIDHNLGNIIYFEVRTMVKMYIRNNCILARRSLPVWKIWNGVGWWKGRTTAEWRAKRDISNQENWEILLQMVNVFLIFSYCSKSK